MPDGSVLVEDRLTGLLQSDSPYMTAARQRGIETANSRGLLNSSIAGGNAEREAISAALPIASQDAQTILQRQMQAISEAGQNARQNAQLQSSHGLAQLQADTQVTLSQMNIDDSTRRLAAELISRERLAIMELSAQRDLSQLDADSRMAIAQLSADTQRAVAELNISAEQQQQILDLASREKISAAQLASNENIAQLDIAAREQLALLDQDTQLRIAEMNVGANMQDKAMNAAISYAQIYSNMVTAITNNPEIPAATRNAMIASAKADLNKNIDLVEAMYGIDLSGTPAAAGTTTTTP